MSVWRVARHGVGVKPEVEDRTSSQVDVPAANPYGATRDEGYCFASPDAQHCAHWWDCAPCHYCGYEGPACEECDCGRRSNPSNPSVPSRPTHAVSQLGPDAPHYEPPHAAAYARRVVPSSLAYGQPTAAWLRQAQHVQKLALFAERYGRAPHVHDAYILDADEMRALMADWETFTALERFAADAPTLLGSLDTRSGRV